MIHVSHEKVNGKILGEKHHGGITMKEKDFVTYEYRTKTVSTANQFKAMDMYESFGWEVTATTPTAIDGITLSLKRDRKQRHKQELTKLEQQAENLFDTINSLQSAKTRGASIFAYIFGIFSTLVLGGGMSLVLLNTDNLPSVIGGSVLGIAGFALCGINYLIYKNAVAKKTKKLLPIIDENEEKLASVLEKGNDLLSRDII